jgi:hypothetical protein
VLYEQVIEPFQRTKVSTNGHRRSGPIPDAITHHRNNTLTSLGGTMRHRGMSEEAIYAALAVVNAERCVPPLDDDEVGRIARSAARYEPAPDGHKPLPSKADKEEEEPPVLSLFTARDIARRQVTWV